jgi:hypothetical protein
MHPLPAEYSDDKNKLFIPNVNEKQNAFLISITTTNYYSVSVVRKRNLPTERLPLVGEVAGKGCCVVRATNSHGR